MKNEYTTREGIDKAIKYHAISHITVIQKYPLENIVVVQFDNDYNNIAFTGDAFHHAIHSATAYGVSAIWCDENQKLPEKLATKYHKIFS